MRETENKQELQSSSAKCKNEEMKTTQEKMTNAEQGNGKSELKEKGTLDEKRRVNETEAAEIMERS